jgi:hypothetical protein
MFRLGIAVPRAEVLEAQIDDPHKIVEPVSGGQFARFAESFGCTLGGNRVGAGLAQVIAREDQLADPASWLVAGRRIVMCRGRIDTSRVADAPPGSLALRGGTAARTRRQGGAKRYGHAILAPVQWLIDNAVLVAFLAGLVAVLVALVVLAVRMLGAYRRVRTATVALSAAGGALAGDVDRVTAALAALPERQAEVQQAIADLSQRAAAVCVLARHYLVAERILRSPFWFVGR